MHNRESAIQRTRGAKALIKMRGEINSKLKDEVFVQMGEGEDAKGNPIVVAPKVSALFGYEKHPQAGENLTAKVMNAADVQAVKAADQDVFNTYSTCSLKDLTSLNIAATSLGMPHASLGGEAVLEARHGTNGRRSDCFREHQRCRERRWPAAQDGHRRDDHATWRKSPRALA